MSVLVLQALTGQGSPPRGSPNQKASTAQVGGSPDEIANPLEAKHRVVNKERNSVNPVGGVGRTSGNKRGHGTRFSDTFFQNLSVGRFFIVK